MFKYDKSRLALLLSSVFLSARSDISLKINYPYDARTEPSETALILAASEGNFQMVKLLLESGLNVNEKDGTGNSTLSVASLNGRPEIVELLLKKGADVNSKDAYGWTPLHFSVVNGSLSVVKLLLGYGANVSAKASFIDVQQFNSTPFSPFMLSSLIGNKEIAEEFLKNGADIKEAFIMEQLFTMPLQLGMWNF